MVAKILAERNNENCPYDLHYPLKPYQHQVGGHTAVFQIDNNHICKPINESELNFYKTMPDDLREWVPKFCYEIEVILLIGQFHQCLQLKSSNLANTYDISISNQNPSCSNYKQGQKQLAECPMITSEGSINPWAIVCQMRSLKSDSSNRRFIALENLCKDYHTPNVLDLKLGIRQYSDNASEEKKLIQKRKCESSTSKQLGMRLCGLQYFDEKTGYNYLDKYAGRSLSVKQLFSLLRHFFQYSNDKVRVNDCLALIDQIEKIRHVSFLNL
jgi:inositol-hexakisphosphate kinase